MAADLSVSLVSGRLTRLHHTMARFSVSNVANQLKPGSAQKEPPKWPALDEYDRRRLGPEAAARLSSHPSPDALAATFLFFASFDSNYVTG
jgi:hypothetical protein